MRSARRGSCASRPVKGDRCAAGLRPGPDGLPLTVRCASLMGGLGGQSPPARTRTTWSWSWLRGPAADRPALREADERDEGDAPALLVDAVGPEAFVGDDQAAALSRARAQGDRGELRRTGGMAGGELRVSRQASG